MPTSTCTSTKHQETTCLIKWGVSSKKFKVEKWCKDCIHKYSDTYIVREHIATNEREKQDPHKSNKTNKNNETKPRRGRKKKNE